MNTKTSKASKSIKSLKGAEWAAVCKATTAAVSDTLASVGKWKALAPSVVELFGTRAAFENARAEFIIDAILPGIENSAAIKAMDIGPRLNGTEYNAKVKANPALAAQYEAAKKAQANLRAVAGNNFNRLRDDYAFPLTESEKAKKAKEREGAERESVAAAGGGDLKKVKGEDAIAMAKILAAAISRVQKAENPTFNVDSVLGHLKAALADVTSGKVSAK